MRLLIYESLPLLIYESLPLLSCVLVKEEFFPTSITPHTSADSNELSQRLSSHAHIFLQCWLISGVSALDTQVAISELKGSLNVLMAFPTKE